MYDGAFGNRIGDEKLLETGGKLFRGEALWELQTGAVRLGHHLGPVGCIGSVIRGRQFRCILLPREQGTADGNDRQGRGKD
jgi:hypothetical protein